MSVSFKRLHISFNDYRYTCLVVVRVSYLSLLGFVHGDLFTCICASQETLKPSATLLLFSLCKPHSQQVKSYSRTRHFLWPRHVFHARIIYLKVFQSFLLVSNDVVLVAV